MSKILTGVIAAVAYVLGAKAGHERYEQIRKKARQWWNDPRVQAKKSSAAGHLKDQAEQVADKLPGSLGGSEGNHATDTGACPDPGAPDRTSP